MRSRRPKRAERPDVNREARRYFVYFALDLDGSPVYIGRSCDVAARLRSHYRSLTHPGVRSATWITDTRSLHMTGPHTWDEAVREERKQIELHQPAGNISLTTRDHRPAVAFQSARRSA